MIALEGDEGSFVVEAGRKGRLFRGGTTESLDLDSPLLSWTSHPWHTAQESVLSTQRAIISAWAAGREAETRGEDNLKTFALVEAAYNSARDGRAYAPKTAAL